MDRTCKNHPDRTTKRKCYHCHEGICSECQLIASHHIFCSVRCHRLFLFHSGLSNVKKRLGKIYTRVRDGFRGLGLSPVRLALELILLAGLLVCVLLLRSVIREVGALKGTRPPVVVMSKSEDIAEPEEPAEAILSIDSKPQAMVLQNTIDINGESDNNVILSLSVNGKLTHVTLAQGGHFHFENVQLRRGSNKIVIRAVGEDGSTVMLEELTTFFGGPTFRYLSRSFNRGSLSKPEIALTFDGGAEENATAEILNFLAEKNIRCTLFLTGAYIDRNKYLVRRMVEDGHEVANHTWSHPHLTTYEINRRHSTRPEVNREMVQSELTRTAQLFERITGKKMAPFWRAPYGEHNLQIRQWAAEIGFRHVGWTIGYGNGETMDTQDWVADTTASNYHSSQEILENILSFGESNSLNANGCITLMHLGTNRTSDQAHKIIPTLIDSLHARGYELVTASKLLR